MLARYYGKCCSCFERIAPGDIIWSRPGGWMHESCAIDRDNAEHAAAQPVRKIKRKVIEKPRTWVQMDLFGGK